MIGSTNMGPWVVYVDFHSAFIMLSYKFDHHRLSIRAEHSSIDEDDWMSGDQNNSSTSAITGAWRYDYSNSIELGAELHFNKNQADNRAQLGLPTQQNDVQLRLVFAYHF